MKQMRIAAQGARRLHKCEAHAHSAASAVRAGKQERDAQGRRVRRQIYRRRQSGRRRGRVIFIELPSIFEFSFGYCV